MAYLSVYLDIWQDHKPPSHCNQPLPSWPGTCHQAREIWQSTVLQDLFFCVSIDRLLEFLV